MKKAVVTALMLALAVSASGCGERKDMASENQKDVLSGTWQTASIGYEMDGELQPESNIH